MNHVKRCYFDCFTCTIKKRSNFLIYLFIKKTPPTRSEVRGVNNFEKVKVRTWKMSMITGAVKVK